MKSLLKALALLLFWTAFGCLAQAQTTAVTRPVNLNAPTVQNTADDQDNPPATRQRQNLGELRKIVEQFIKVQTSGLSGTVNIAVEAVDSRLNLPVCPVPQAFLPNGGRLWGNTTIGIKCNAPTAWTIYVPASVQVMADYIAARTPLTQGQIIGPGDIVHLKGDLSALPGGIITDETQAIGRTVAMSLAAGAPLRQDALRTSRVIQQGQAVRIISNGAGFQVTAEGRALNNAGEGQIAQAKTNNGQVVSGVARAGGIVEINY